MNFRLTDEQIERRKEFFDVCKHLEKQKPLGYLGSYECIFDNDENWQYSRWCCKEFAHRGWTTLNWPPEYEGKGDMMDRVLLREAMGYHGIPGLDELGVAVLAPMLLAAANEDIKRNFLPPIAAAEAIWCELWSEPNAGSDLASLNTTAAKRGNEYIINGQKIWNSGANKADWGFGIFKTDPSGRKHHNLSLLLVDMKTSGITIRPIPYMNGVRSYCEVFFDDVHVPANHIVGHENEGWAIVNNLAALERTSVDEVMAMLRRLEDLVRYCNETMRGGKPLSHDQLISNRIASLACELEAARMLSYRVADLQNRNEMALANAAAVKIFSSELGERFSNLATDILGNYGQVKTSRWSHLNGFWENQYQVQIGFAIGAGTNEIQRNIIAWYGLNLPRIK